MSDSVIAAENKVLWKVISVVLGIIVLISTSVIVYAIPKCIELEMRLVKLEAQIPTEFPPERFMRQFDELKCAVKDLAAEVSKLKRREDLTAYGTPE